MTEYKKEEHGASFGKNRYHNRDGLQSCGGGTFVAARGIP